MKITREINGETHVIELTTDECRTAWWEHEQSYYEDNVRYFLSEEIDEEYNGYTPSEIISNAQMMNEIAERNAAREDDLRGSQWWDMMCDCVWEVTLRFREREAKHE